MCELISTLKAPVFVEQRRCFGHQNILRARRAIRKVREIRLKSDTRGNPLPCPTNLARTP